MAYQYGQSWPMTPITPIHSPHPSGGSSIRTRTPGQLSLHEYRKMQVTPSPPAIAGQKTVKKKRGVSSLSRNEGTPARSQDVNFYSSFQSLTTPPETPSLGLRMDFTPDVLPVDARNRPRVAHAPVDTTYPEFEHLLSPGSELLQNSPPYSPPSLPSSASRNSVLRRSVGTQNKLSRPWTQHWQQDHRYVESRKLHSEVPRPKSEQAARRVDSVGAAAVDTSGTQDNLKAQLQSHSRWPVFVPDFSTRSAPPSTGSHRYSRLPEQRPTGNISQQPQEWSRNLSRTTGELKGFELSDENLHSRERHFNTIKRLPRPNASEKRRPAPLRLTTNNAEGLYLSETNTESTSTFSLSKYPFPHPPKSPADFADVQPFLPPVQDFAVLDSRLLTAKSPSVRFSGVSFEIVNPRLSLEDAKLLSSSEEGGVTNSDLSGNFVQEETQDMSSNDGEGPRRPRRHSTLQGAHEAITGSSFQGAPPTPGSQASPTTPHRSFTAPPYTPSAVTCSPWMFDGEGQRISPRAELLTGSIQAGPSASQHQLNQPILARPRRLEFPPALVPIAPSTQTAYDTLRSSSSVATLRASPRAIQLQNSSHVQAPTNDNVNSSNGYSGHPSLTNFYRYGRGGDGIDTTRSTSVPPCPQVYPSLGSSSFDVDSLYGGRDSSYLDQVSRVSDALSALPSGDRYSSYASIFTGGSGNPFVSPSQGRQSTAVRSSGFSSFADHNRDSNVDPFAYENYLRSPHRDNSTLSHLIGQYGHHRHTADARDKQQPLDTFHEEDEGDALRYPGVEVRSPIASTSHVYGDDTGIAGPSSAPDVSSNVGRPERALIGALAYSNGPATHLGNGHSHGGSASLTARLPLWQRYGLPDGGSDRRRIPIEDIEEWEDFVDLVRDMEYQPILQEVDDAYIRRYRALMRRIELLHGLNARQQSQDQVRRVYYESMSELNIGSEMEARESGHCASHGARNTAGTGSPSQRPTHTGIGASVVRDQGVPSASFRSQFIDEDDEFIQQHEAESNSSPLDYCPQPPQQLPQAPWESHIPQIGPPPHGPLPTLPANTNADLPPIRPLFTSRTPVESSNISTYGNTGQLLNLQSPTPSQPSVGRHDTGSAINRPEQHHAEPSGRSRGIPEMWTSNSPPGTGSYRHRSQNSDSELSLSQTTSRVADAMNDAEEWVTEPSSSRHNSAMPDQYTRVKDHTGPSIWADCRSDPHVNVSDDPDYKFGSRVLAKAPYDGAEPTFEPARVANHAGQPYEDIELGMRLPSSPRVSRNSRIALPLPTRIRHRSNDTDVTAFPSSRDLKSPSTRYPVSVRSGNSRYRPASVHGQTSQIQLLMTPSRVAITTPVTIQRPEFVPKAMSRSEKLLADLIRYSCVTWLAPLGLFPFLLGVGVLEFWVKGRASKQMKRFALAEAFIVFIVIAVAATVGITLSIRDERRANGSDY